MNRESKSLEQLFERLIELPQDEREQVLRDDCDDDRLRDTLRELLRLISIQIFLAWQDDMLNVLKWKRIFIFNKGHLLSCSVNVNLDV